MNKEKFYCLPKFIVSDYQAISNDRSIEWDDLKRKTILITGASGEIGSELVKVLLFANYERDLNIRILANIRTINGVKDRFSKFASTDGVLKIICSDVSELCIEEGIDFIIHGASPTASQYFVTNPVETITTIVNGTKNILDIAKYKNIQSMVFLSTMEIYGNNITSSIKEQDLGGVETMSARSSYPEAKRLAEALCFANYAEYSVPVKVARLTQTFGTHISMSDNRVYAQFLKCAKNNENIILHTKGETKRDYIYTLDAVRYLLTILTKGKNGNAYNVSNPDNFISIKQFADKVATLGQVSKVVVDENQAQGKGYLPISRNHLNIDKIKSLNIFKMKSIDCMINDLFLYGGEWEK